MFAVKLWFYNFGCAYPLRVLFQVSLQILTVGDLSLNELAFRGRARAADLAALATGGALTPVAAKTLDQPPQPNEKGGDGNRQKQFEESNEIMNLKAISRGSENAQVR